MSLTNQFELLFLQMTKVTDYPWEVILDSLNDGVLDQAELARHTIFHPHVRSYPPSAKYIKLFLKTFISKLEESGIEVNEAIYDHYIQLLNSTDEEHYFYRTYCFRDDLKISIKETRNIISDGTTGLTTWQACRVLSNYLLDRKEKFNLKSVLELGSGLGVTGLVTIKRLGLTSFTFSDHHSTVLDWLCENVSNNLSLDKVQCNGPGVRWYETDVNVLKLDWEDDNEFSVYDFVIAADILFEPKLIPAIVRTIIAVLRNSSTSRAIIASTLRNEETFKEFVRVAESKHLKEEERESQEFRNSPSGSVDTVIISTFFLDVER